MMRRHPLRTPAAAESLFKSLFGQGGQALAVGGLM
jgi:hypothetical protein